MTRITIWRWLTQGLPAGQIMPPWLVACHAVLFPRRSLLWWLNRDCGFDMLGCCWTIHGVRFNDRVFTSMAQPRLGALYRFEREPGSSIVTITEIREVTSESNAMTSNARAQRLINEFKEGAAFAGGHSVRHGLAAVLRHLVDTEANAGWISVATLQQCADALTAPTLLDCAMAGDPQAARQFLRESGFTDASGNLLPQFQSLQETND